MIDQRLKAIQKVVESSDDKVAAWRHAYRNAVGATLHGLHRIAVEAGIGPQTAGDWLTLDNVHEPPPSQALKGEPLPMQGMWATYYVRGYALNLAVRPDGETWAAAVDVEDCATRVFEHRVTAGTFDDAYRQAIAAALAFIESR